MPPLHSYENTCTNLMCLQSTVIESYERTGKHTYFPMAVTIGAILITLVALVVLYNKLGPRSLSVEIQAANCVPSNVDTEQEETDSRLQHNCI